MTKKDSRIKNPFCRGFLILLVFLFIVSCLTFSSTSWAVTNKKNSLTMKRLTKIQKIEDDDKVITIKISRVLPSGEKESVKTGYSLHISGSPANGNKKYIEISQGPLQKGSDKANKPHKDENKYIIPIIFDPNAENFIVNAVITPYAPNKATLNIDIKRDDSGKVKANYKFQGDAASQIQIVHNPIMTPPNVSVDDKKNFIKEITPYMEYRESKKEDWRAYIPSIPPGFEGKRIVYVRRAAVANGGRTSKAIALKFTDNKADKDNENGILASAKDFLKSTMGAATVVGVVIVLVFILLILWTQKHKASQQKSKNVVKGKRSTVKIASSPQSGINIGNAQNIGARENQQDSFGISDVQNKELCSEKGVISIVADGMGGLENGAEVSAIVTSSILNYFNSQKFHSNESIELLNMLMAANNNVNNFLTQNGRGKSGSTVVATLVKDMDMYWISVGDSRIYLYREGRLIQVNREHNYGADLDEQAARGLISVEEARNDPQRHALTSYIGMGELERIDRNIHPLKLKDGDRILLMSDGVFGTLSDEEIVESMSLSVFEAADDVEKKVLMKNKPHQDNFTVVIIECFDK